MVPKQWHLNYSFDNSSSSSSNLDDLILFYDNDLTNSGLVNTELWRWRAKWEGQDAANRPSSLEAALKNCD